MSRKEDYIDKIEDFSSEKLPSININYNCAFSLEKFYSNI